MTGTARISAGSARSRPRRCTGGRMRRGSRQQAMAQRRRPSLERQIDGMRADLEREEHGGGMRLQQAGRRRREAQARAATSAELHVLAECRGMSDDGDSGQYHLRLYVAGQTSKSLARRMANLRKRFCDEHLAGRFEIEVIDLLDQPEACRRRSDTCHPDPGPASPVAVEADHRRPLEHGKGAGRARHPASRQEPA